MENQRITLSKRLLKDALLSLLSEKDFIDISIKELCERSGINRSTFYRHYDNLSDLYREIIDDLFSLMSKASSHALQDPANATSYIRDVLSFFRDHKEYDPLFGSDLFSSDLFARRAEDHIKDSLTIKNSRYRKYLIRYLLAGSYTIIKDWITTGRKEDVDTISDILLTLNGDLLN